MNLGRRRSWFLAAWLTALAGLALWLGGLVHFTRRALDADDRLVPRVAAGAGLVVLVGLVVWVIGLAAA